MRYAARALRWAACSRQEQHRNGAAMLRKHGTDADLQLIFEDRCGTGQYAPALNEIRYPGLVKI
jgi:hypothetical protein